MATTLNLSMTMMSNRDQPAGVNPLDSLQNEIAELIVAALNLETTPAEIQPDDPLFDKGLGLDSIDILEVALVLSKRYGIQLRSDSEDNAAIFRSLRSLARYIAEHRTK